MKLISRMLWGDDKFIIDASGKRPSNGGTEGANQHFRNAGESLR